MSKAEQLARRVVELFAFTRDPQPGATYQQWVSLEEECERLAREILAEVSE